MKKNEYERMEVVSVSDLNQKQFDVAADVPLFCGESKQELEDWKGIGNLTTGKICAIAGKDYQIIQNNDVRTAVCQTLERLNLDIKGRVNNYHNKVVMDLVFQKEGLEIKDDAQGIMLGFRVVNSYNKTTSFSLSMFGFRKICQNGMTFGAQQLGVREITIHYGSKEKNLEAISLVTERFIKQVINSSDIMQTYVNDMIGDSLEYNMAVRIIKAMVAKKHYDKIIQRLSECKTRWDMYNAITNFATHDYQLTPFVIEHMERLSRKVMETPCDKLIAEAMEKELEIEN